MAFDWSSAKPEGGAAKGESSKFDWGSATEEAPKPEATAGGLIRSLAASAVDAGIGFPLQAGGEVVAAGLNKVTGTENFRAENPLGPISKMLRDNMSEGDKLAAQDVPKGDILSPSTWELPETGAGMAHTVASGAGSLGSMLIPGTAAYRAGKLAAGATTVAEKAAAKAAIKRATATGAVAGAATTGGAAANEVREGVDRLTDDQLYAQSPKFKELVDSGVDRGTARQTVENTGAQAAGAISGVAGGLSGALNAKLLEDVIAKRGIPAIIGNLSQKGAVRAGVGAGVGAVAEGAQEAAEKVGQNIGENIGMGNPALANATRDTFGDALGGALIGGPIGAVGGAVASPGAGATPPAGGAPPVPPVSPPQSPALGAPPAQTAAQTAQTTAPPGISTIQPPTAAEIAEGLKMGGGAIPINQDVDGVPVMTGLRFNGKTYEPDDAGIQSMYQAAGNLARAKAQGLTPFTDTIEGRAPSGMEEQAQADLADMRKFGGSNVKKTTERIPAVIRSIKEAAAAPDAGPLAIAAAAGVDSGAVQQAAIEQATAADTQQMTQVEASQQEAAKTAETAQKEADKAAATAKKEADQKAATENKARRTAEADKAKAEDRAAKSSADGEKVAKLHARFVGLQSKMRPEEVDGTKKVLDKLLSGKVSQAEHDQYEKMAGTMERMLGGRAKKGAAKTASEKPSQPTPAPTETQSGGEKSFSAPAGDEKRSPADQQFIESLPPESKEHADLAIKAHAKNPDLTTAALEHPEMGPKAERTIFEAIIHGRTNDRETRAIIARFGLPEPAAKRGDSQAPEGRDQRNADGADTKASANAGDDNRGTGVDAGAHEAASSPRNDKTATKEQILGGNAELGHVNIAGLDISIENPEGSTRTDLQNDPPQWSTKMKAHYGYIKGTIGKDKDHLDVFIKPGTPEDFAGQVFVIDQKNADGGFDEHKIMLGYAGLPEALKAYKAHYPKGWDGVMGSTGMAMAEFKEWIKGDTTKPVTKAAVAPSKKTAVAQKPKHANMVIRDVRDRHGAKLGDVMEPYDGTIEGARKAAEVATQRMYYEYPDAGNVASRMGATDEAGNPKWAISPNFAHINPVDSLDGRATFGDSEAIQQVFGPKVAKDVTPAKGSFDSEAFDRERNERIEASRKAGNVHLDKVPAYVESMRGKRVRYVHDPKVTGTIRTVDNRGNVYIDWADEYSAQKEMASPVQEGKRMVMRSSLGPNDLKDYAVVQDAETPKTKTRAKLDAQKSEPVTKVGGKLISATKLPELRRIAGRTPNKKVREAVQAEIARREELRAASQSPEARLKRAQDKSRKGVWRAIVAAGGISEKEAADLNIDPRSLGGYRMSGLITKNGMRSDILAEFLFNEGYLSDADMQDGGDGAARQFVQDMLAGEFVGTPEQANEYHALLSESHDEAAIEASGFDDAPIEVQAEVADFDVDFGGKSNVTEDEFLAALGADEQEIEDARKSRSGEGSGEVAADQGRTRQTGRDEPAGPQDRAAPGRGEVSQEPAFALDSQTSEDLAAQARAAEEVQAAADRAAKAKDEAERQERVRKEIAARSVAAAGEFQLGQTQAEAEATLAGQGDIFSQPAAKPKDERTADEKMADFRKMVAEQKANRARLEAKLARLFERDGAVKGIRKESKYGQYLLLTAGMSGTPYRVTSIDDQGPSGHRDYNSIEEAANEFISNDIAIVDGPAPKVAKPVTPQVASAGMLKTFIGIAADSIEQLRKVDVERVLTSNPKIYQAAIAQHIKDKRPDLAGEVDDVLSDQPPPTPVAESQAPAPSEPGDRGVAPAQEKGVAEPAPAIFGLSGAQLEAMQGGKLRGAEQFAGVAPTEKQVADRKALVAKRKADEAAAVDKAALDPRIAALRDSGVEAGILLKAEKELQGGDDSLIKDLARIQGIELPAEPKAESVSRETPKDEPLASRSAPTEAVADMFGYTDADEDALLLDMDAQERAEYEKSKPRGMSWLDHAKQQYARIKGDYRSLKAKPFVSATYGADLPWQESARNRDGDALRALRSEAARLEKDAPARLYINHDGTARITVFDARDVPKRMLAFAERNNLKTDVVVSGAMLQAGNAMPEANRASGAKYAVEMATPDAKNPFASRPGYTAPYRDLDAARFTVKTSKTGMPVYLSRTMALSNAREKDAFGVPKGGRALAFDIFDRRMKDANGMARKVGMVLVHQDADGKFVSLRNIQIDPKYREQGYYHGEGVIAGMLLHNGTTPMEVFNIQSAAKGDEDNALPFWKTIGTTILNNSSDPDVIIEGNISLARYMSAGEKRANYGQSSRDSREQPISRRDEARVGESNARRDGGDDGRGSRTGRVDAVRAELTEAFGETGVAALEREGILQITTWDNAPKNLTDQLQSGDHGAYWPSRKAAYIFADNLAPGQAVEVLLHEIGEHYGLKEMLGDRYDRTVAQVKTLHKAGNKAIVAAWKHVERNYDLEPGSPVFMQEVIAKAGQSADVRKMAWWQRLIADIKAFLIKVGLKNVTSERDLGILLRASVRKAMRDAKGQSGPIAVDADEYGLSSSAGGDKRGKWYSDANEAQQATLDRWEDERSAASNFQDLDIRRAGEDVYESASAHFNDYEVARGLFEIPMADVGPFTGYNNAKDSARIQNLAERIKENGEIEPLFVALEGDGQAYVMEGQHRARALQLLGYTSIPARVVVDMDHYAETEKPLSARLSDQLKGMNKGAGGDLFKGAVELDGGMSFRDKQVSSPAFKAWFGDSKVVDAEGKPLVVYHGTDMYGPGHGIDALMNPIASRAKRGAGRGVSVPELTRLAAAMGGNIKVAPTQGDLPESASRFRSEISTGVRGVFIPKTGEIYLVAENLQNLAEGAFVAMHEGAHRGLRKLFGDELKPVLNRIWMGNKNVRTKTAEYMAQYNIDKMEAIEEVLADMAMEGTAKDLTGWEMLVEFIKTWVAKFGDMIGAKLPITDDMVEIIVSAASRKGLEGDAVVFDDALADKYSKVAPTFYSALADAVAKIPARALTPEAWWQNIESWNKKGVVKNEELQWSEVEGWLSLQSGKVTKEQFLSFLRENGVKVETVRLGGKIPESAVEAVEKWMYDHTEEFEAMDYRVSKEDMRGLRAGDAEVVGMLESFGVPAELLQPIYDNMGDGATKFSNWKLPGGDEYREVLMTLPEADAITQKRALMEQQHDAAKRGDTAEVARLDRLIDAASKQASGAQQFRSNHWDQPNVVAHFRADVVTGADGKRYLRPFEFQSDWGQQGKKNGFKQRQTQRLSDGEWRTFMQGLREEYAAQVADKIGITIEEGREIARMTNEDDLAKRVGKEEEFAQMAARRDDDVRESHQGGFVPTGPFVTKTEAWLSLAIKRAIRMAADEGLDGVVFANGQQMADLFDLSKRVDQIRAVRKGEDQYSVSAVKNDSIILNERDIDSKRLADLVGKELAEKISGHTIGERKDYSGLDLKVGGVGMRAFYDKIVPNVANDVLRKLGGGKVGMIELRERDTYDAEDGPQPGFESTQPGFPITDALRERALAGMPLFSRLSDQLKGMNKGAGGDLFKGAVELDGGMSFRDKQVSSPAFKNWFGDSKIVDANGRPLVVYHRSGPQADFESFVPHKPKTVYRAGDQELIEAMSWDMGNDGQGAPDAYHYMAISDAAFMGAEKALEIRRAEAKTSTHPDTLRLLRDLERLQGKDVVRSTEVRPSGDGSYFTPDPGYSFIRQPGAGAVYPVYLRIENPLYLNSSQIEGAGLDFNVEKYRAMGYDGAIFRSDPTDLTRAKWGEFTQIVIFDGNQAKSAISNNGNFDPNEPGIMASRPGTIGATWDMLQSAKTPAQARALAMNLFDNPNKFNLWDKTIGTQLTKARKNEYFRAVFDALQAQQDSTAAYAIEAEAEAADVLARMEGMGEIKSALKSTFTGLKFEKGSILPQGERARDLQAVSKAIFSNIEGRSGVKQRVFTDFELKRDFDLNDRQIALYRQSRAAIDRSLDRYAQSLAVRMAQKFVYTGDLHRAGLDDTVEALTERMQLQRQVLEDQKEPEQSVEDMEARLEELKELRQAMPREILRSLQVGPDGETRQEFVGVPDTAAATALEKEIRDVRRSIERGASKENAELDAKIEALDAALSKLPEIAEQANSLKDKGYAPAMRFGDYAVTATQGGETVFFTMVDTKTQANLLKMRLAREMPGAELRVNPVDRESFKLFGGVDPATVELFARFMEVEENDAFKAYIALATSSRSALKHMLERKGIAGFSDNLPRVMAAFITSNSRAAARNIHGFDVNAATEATQKNARGDVSEEAAKLVNYMNNPTGDFAKVRGFMFAYFMGGSVSSALVNLTQPLMMTTPYLEQFAGKKIGGIMVRASKASATGKVEGPMKAALARAEAEGITDAHEYHQLMQEAEGGGSVATRALMKSWGSMFGAAERFNRRITFLAAFETGQGMTKEELSKQGVSDAYEFAANAVAETQGIYARHNRPNWARNPVGALAMTFKQYSISWVEFFIRLPRKQQLMALGLLTLMAGLEGLPFAEDLEDLIDTIGQRMGRGTNSKKALRQAATNILGETGAQFALHGISGLAGMPMDVAGRLGMGNLIPGTKLLNPSIKDKGREALEIVGPAGGLAQKAAGILDGNVKEAMPKAFADAAKAWEMLQTGEYRDTRGRKVMDVDGMDSLMKMIGFQPAALAADSRRIGESMRDIDIVKRVESEITSKWAQGIIEKDPAKVEEAKKQLIDWNQANADMPIRVGSPQIARRVREAMVTRDVRFIKTAPPEMRANIMREMHQ